MYATPGAAALHSHKTGAHYPALPSATTGSQQSRKLYGMHSAGGGHRIERTGTAPVPKSATYSVTPRALVLPPPTRPTRPSTAPTSKSSTPRESLLTARTQKKSVQQRGRRSKEKRNAIGATLTLGSRSPSRRQNHMNDSGNKAVMNVVLPPRKFSSLSSTSVLGGESPEKFLRPSCRPCSAKTEVDGGKLQVKGLHYESAYSPHKTHWIKNALENLGVAWVKDGKITYDQLISEKFEEKMAVLYDLAMAKKHDAIDRLVSEVMEEEEETEDCLRGAHLGGAKCKKKSKQGSGKGVPCEKLEEHVQKNFPFAPHISENVKSSMSDHLLRIMMREETANEGSNTTKDGGASTDKESVSDSFESSLLNCKRGGRSLVQCYVVDGGKLVIGTKKGLLRVGGSFVNRFADSGHSRIRKQASTESTNNSYFYRRTSNMMGFLSHEVKIRYCKDSRQIIVNGKRPQRSETENARQVREVLEVPKNVDIRRLIVMRTVKGSLIFEESLEDEDEEWSSNVGASGASTVDTDDTVKNSGKGGVGGSARENANGKRSKKSARKLN